MKNEDDTLQSEAILQVDGIEKYFGSYRVVGDISFDIAEGEAFALLGPSGCGKTTTLRMVAGLESPTGGRIRLRGRDVTALPPHRRSIGFVFQDFALFPHLSVFENVAFGLRLKSRDRDSIKARVASALASVRLPVETFGDRYPNQISGGQRQRVAIARTLVTDPLAVLFDEPLAALDRHLRDHMLIELKELQHRSRLPAIYVTHDQEAAMILADRVAVMNQGAIQQIGTPQEIYRRPANRFVAEFMGEVAFVPALSVESSSEGTSIRIGDETLWAGPSDFAPETRLVAGFRPGDLSLCPPGDGDIRATVTGCYFTGLAFLVQLEIAGGVTLSARLEAETAPAPGTEVGVRATPGHVILLPS
ncbi:MAG: ABC transporter ATP-binding protein [Zavarzinia sp.]|nr:ABC transporter ATP-binding protein [Zavarzinia sp.]